MLHFKTDYLTSYPIGMNEFITVTISFTYNIAQDARLSLRSAHLPKGLSSTYTYDPSRFYKDCHQSYH